MLKLSLTKLVRKPYQPKKNLVTRIIQKSLLKKYQQVSIAVTIVSEKKSHEFNLHYRGIAKPTNVIALEYSESREQFNFLTGEVILCDHIIVAEATMQDKDITDHYVHMLVHAMLHLQGLDHIVALERKLMEKHEIRILKEFAIKNPYINLK